MARARPWRYFAVLPLCPAAGGARRAGVAGVCVPALWPLLAQGAPGIERLVPPEQAAAEAGQVDFWAPLLSLPQLTESGDNPLGDLVPYLHAERSAGALAGAAGCAAARAAHRPDLERQSAEWQ